MNNTHMLDILVKNYNNADYIEECLNSITAQKIEFDYTIYIQDDCSTDRSVELIEQFIEANKDIKVVFEQNESNRGSLFTTIKLYEKVTHPYWTVLDSDDYWLPGFINRALKTLAADGNLHGYASNTYLLENGKRTTYYRTSSPGGVRLNPPYYPHTSSCVFSSYIFRDGVPELFYEAQQSGNKYVAQAWGGDSSRNALCLTGKSCFYDWKAYGGVYRITNKGIWTCRSALEKTLLEFSLQATYTAFVVKYGLPVSLFSITEDKARARLAKLHQQVHSDVNKDTLTQEQEALEVLSAFLSYAFKPLNV
jgi:glycosyltransferase involved in cell wall biosynthesis